MLYRYYDEHKHTNSIQLHGKQCGGTFVLEETQNAAVMYNVSASIVPQTPLIILSQDLGNITVEITSLTYNVNIPYSVSINVSVCRRVSGTATIPLLFSKFYIIMHNTGNALDLHSFSLVNSPANCRHPLLGINDKNLMLIDDIDSSKFQWPIVEGTNFTLGCFHNQKLKTVTCLENGKWQPDPDQINCEG